MRTVRRVVSILLVASALAAACGDDEEDAPTTIPTSAPTTAAAPTTSTSVPATVVQNATDGAVCSPRGARGMTRAGLALVCEPIAGGNELRWRPA